MLLGIAESSQAIINVGDAWHIPQNLCDSWRSESDGQSLDLIGQQLSRATTTCFISQQHTRSYFDYNCREREDDEMKREGENKRERSDY